MYESGLNRHGRLTSSCWFLALLLATSAQALPLPLAHDQSNLSEVNGYFLSSAIAANDFVVDGRVRITAAEVWLQDSEFGDNGDLESFNGTLSWAIYQNSVGSLPGDGVAVGKAVRRR